jgi:putative proteasome-type protease
MTYCVGIRLNAGLVFLSDSRTNAGMDQISTFRKMMIYEKPGDRFMVMLSAGNLSASARACARSCRWKSWTTATTSR